MSTDRKLPAIIYGSAPVPDWAWHGNKRVSTNSEYSGDACRADRIAEIRKRHLSLEEPFPRAPEHLDGVTRMKQEKARTVTITPLQVPKGATMVYCVKTGQHVGQMLTSYEYPPHAVHPDWIATDGSNLDTMQDKDARAYVAFCFGLVDTFWRQKCQRGQKLNSRYMNKVDALEHHWSLVKAYDTLGQVTEYHLRELADAIGRLCFYAPLSYRVLDEEFTAHQRQADQLANVAVDGSLLISLQKATTRTILKAQGYAEAGASVKTAKFEIVPKSIAEAAQGPSNIRAQKKPREYHQAQLDAKNPRNAKQNRMMLDIWKTLTPEQRELLGMSDKPAKRSQASNLLARLSGNQDKNTVIKTADSEADEWAMSVDAFMLGGSHAPSAWSDDTDDDMDDDTVEMRFIPRAAVESLQEPATVRVQETTISPIQEKPRLGMFARLAGKKE